jgi:hypothetical protein
MKMTGLSRHERVHNPTLRRAEATLLVKALELALFPLELLEMTLDGSGSIAFANGGRLLVVFATTNLGEYARFFAGTLETTQRYVKRFILFHFNSWH